MRPADTVPVLPPLIERRADNPQACLHEWLADADGDPRLLLVHFPLLCHWLPDAPTVDLTAVYLHHRGGLELTVTDQPLIPDGSEPVAQLRRWEQCHGLARVRSGQALSLSTRHIPKPWGQEIWYTGVEARGVCSFLVDGVEIPIPWLRAALPAGQTGDGGTPLVLLKILDPLPAEVTGDLYFELHREKREVYVVTHVDRAAWPDGIGAIRYGFSREVVASYPDEAAFRRAYLDAVLDYERVRRGIDAGDIIPGPGLRAREVELRRRMEAFTQLRPLRVGDVVKVPLYLPHSLQHGVRTVEFQTPVYERQILSFGQKVLTQGHWDTREAVSVMALYPPDTEDLEVLGEGDGWREERIVDFRDFEVRRIALAGGAAHTPGPLSSYALVMVVSGRLGLDGIIHHPEQALLLPGGWSGELASADPTQPLLLLLALPR